MITRSIQDLGLGRSVVLDKNNVTIAGNKTVTAARAAGIKNVRIIDSDGTDLVAVRRTDLDLSTDAVAQKLAIADNRTAEVDLSWDPFNLAKMAHLDMSPFFTPMELGALTAAARGETTATDEAPDLPDKAEVRTKPGDLYTLGRHRLYCGDSTKPESIALALGGQLAHMVWTDPPYNVDYVGKTAEALTIQNDKKSDVEFAAFLNDSMLALASGLTPGGSCYVAHADSWGHLFRLAYLNAGLLLKQTLIWAKDMWVMGRQDYQWGHEPILYGFKAAQKASADIVTGESVWEHDPILVGWKAGDAHSWYSNRRQSTILSFARPKRSAVHPTMKPVALVEYCIRNHTVEGDRVLDGFGGSGTTLMACEASNRNATLLELDPAYCDVIVQRFEEHTGIKATVQHANAAD
jgi:site-specific DNA-methyltransferase (adenine-specific)